MLFRKINTRTAVVIFYRAKSACRFLFFFHFFGISSGRLGFLDIYYFIINEKSKKRCSPDETPKEWGEKISTSKSKMIRSQVLILTFFYAVETNLLLYFCAS